MFSPPQPIFAVKPPDPPIVVAMRNNGGWGVPAPYIEPPKPEWHDDSELKRLFGTRLGKGDKPFNAALFVFNNDQVSASWAHSHWLHDKIVLETRESVENDVNLLDKEQLCMKLLKMADEKINGIFVHELKDRTALLKLYAEIQGHIGKVNIDMSKNSFTNNEMKITFVEAEQEKLPERVIEHKEINDLENALKVDLKLVG